MLNLKFKIDKHHLAYKYVLRYFGDINAPLGWATLKQDLIQQYGAYPGFSFFEPTEIGHGLSWFNIESSHDTVIRDQETVRAVFEAIFRSKVFQEVYAATEEYADKLTNIWEEGTSHVEEYEQIIRLNISAEATVLVLSPELGIGSYISNSIIEWGNSDLFDNYQLIGLCHEFLHVLTEKQFMGSKTEEEKWLLHALIYLSADEELRLRMNGGEYFMGGHVTTYHPRLIETARKYLPAWKDYLVNTEFTIIDLYETLQKDLSQ